MRIKLDNLTKAFGSHTVLDEINFEDDFTTLAMVGSSGGGKSTLLRIIASLLEPTSGQVILDGRPAQGSKKEQLSYRRRLGFVFQQNGLLKHLSAVDNITMPLIKVHGYSKSTATERAIQLLDRFGLRGEADKYPYALSGGQSQRIAIARAIAPNPSLLLLDEPTSALDPEYTIEVLDMIGELKDEGRNFIIVTHEMGFARKACEKTMFLYDGKIEEYGYSRQLFSAPRSPMLKKFLATLLEWNVTEA